VWILGIETATWTASVGVTRDGHPVAERTQHSESSHAPTILLLIDDALRAAGIAVADLGAIAVSTGPGSFTGLRIGLSTAKGLAYACKTPIVAVPTLTALARAAGPREGPVCPVLDARKGEVYAACFRWCDGRLEQTAAERTIAPAQLARLVTPPCTLIGDAVDVYGEVLRRLFGARATLLSVTQVAPSGVVVAQLGHELLACGGDSALAALEPHYVRASEAELKAG